MKAWNKNSGKLEVTSGTERSEDEKQRCVENCRTGTLEKGQAAARGRSWEKQLPSLAMNLELMMWQLTG